MVFDKRVCILSFRETSPGLWRWVETCKSWANPELQKGSNLFSKVGLGARSVVFSIHPRKLTLHQAFHWQGRHCFLTAIDRKSPVLMEVSAALVETVDCTISRLPEEPGADKRPQKDREHCSFPGILTEKYQGFEQKLPMGQVSQTFVLVTPKEIQLIPGDLVETHGHGDFMVHICHSLDRYKNEYEMHRGEDV